ncbi:MAG: ferric reductase-like transmembrane domain-containing protein [archaeon]|nr:ferric reductase-like transmembrane domain-containing protein [archaeon]
MNKYHLFPLFGMHTHEFRAYLNSAVIFLIFVAHYSFKYDDGLPANIARAAVIAATVLIAITLFLGPLSRVFPNHFRHDLIYRKPLGLMGFFFAMLYTGLLFFYNYSSNLWVMLSPQNPDMFANLAWFAAALILLALAATSTAASIRNIGFPSWKIFQRFGYLALILMVLHLSYMSGDFLETTVGKTVLALCFTAIAAKLIVVFVGMTKQHSALEINHLTKK